MVGVRPLVGLHGIVHARVDINGKRPMLIGTSARGANGAPGAASCGALVMMRGEGEEGRPGLLDDVQS